MRRIEITGQFKRDYRKVKATPKHRSIDVEFQYLLSLLVKDADLPSRCRDHAMVGNLKDHRDCHIKPDLVLIYRKIGDVDGGALQLVRIGSHSELEI